MGNAIYDFSFDDSWQPALGYIESFQRSH